MTRKLSRSFFWIDQQIIRGGIWLKLSPQARLTSIALSASVDREGLSIWHPTKLMELAGIDELERFNESLVELIGEGLIESLSTQPSLIRLCALQPAGEQGIVPQTESRPLVNLQNSAVVVLTHTTVHFGKERNDVKP